MKTSTKNAIIEGVFTLIAGFIGGFFVGHNLQNSEIKDVVKQSGLVNISQNDSSHDIIIRLLDIIDSLKEEISDLKNKEEESITTEKNTESPVMEEKMSINPSQLMGDFISSLLKDKGDFVEQDNGYRLEDWLFANGKWYYIDPITRKIKTGWQLIENKWYYMDPNNGDMKTDWQLIENKWYYMDPNNGDMKTDWQLIENKWYYMDPNNGDMKTDWQLIGGKWYYMDPRSGSMKTGWQLVENKWYYMAENGECLSNTTTPDGYTVNERGEWVMFGSVVFEK